MKRLAIILSVPLLLSAQAGPNKPPEKVIMANLGIFRVAVPSDGKWEVRKDESPLGINFSKYKEGLLASLAGQGRGLNIGVHFKILEPSDWRWTEKEFADYIIRYNIDAEAQDQETPGVLADKGETVIKDRKLYFVKFNESYPAVNQKIDSAYYFYFPPDFKRTHSYFEFYSAFVHPGGGAIKLYQNPGTEAAQRLIESLEIIDPLQAVPGPEGDLLRAAAAGVVDAAREALDKGAKPDAASPGLTALAAAALYGHREVVDLLLGRGANINGADTQYGRTPLHLALVGGEPEIAEALIQAGAAADPRTLAGYTPLMYAAIGGHSGLISTLQERGADINAKTSDGETALIFAAQCGSIEMVGLLLDKKADLDAQTRQGWTALMHALDNEHADVARSLLERGADVRLKSKKGWTALASAASLDDLGTVRALIDKGADVNGRTEEGTTALMIAAGKAPADVVKLLLEKGANVNVKNSYKQTALKYASRAKRTDIVQILKAAGAKG